MGGGRGDLIFNGTELQCNFAGALPSIRGVCNTVNCCISHFAQGYGGYAMNFPACNFKACTLSFRTIGSLDIYIYICYISIPIHYRDYSTVLSSLYFSMVLPCQRDSSPKISIIRLFLYCAIRVLRNNLPYVGLNALIDTCTIFISFRE